MGRSRFHRDEPVGQPCIEVKSRRGMPQCGQRPVIERHGVMRQGFKELCGELQHARPLPSTSTVRLCVRTASELT
jgi:hypothetical protein